MSNIIKNAKEEAEQLEKTLKIIDEFLDKAPKGCLKWQNKKGKTYYVHQQKLEGDEEESENSKVSKWVRKYIKKQDISLAKTLAQKHYYLTIRPSIEKKVNELNRFIDIYEMDTAEDVYDSLCDERKRLVRPISISMKEKMKQWHEEIYEKNTLYSENLRYETEQGDFVRSKSEVIIANILYQNRKHILYKYEKPLEVMEQGRVKTIYPDFTVLNLHTGKVSYWEHAGMMDNPYYANEFVKKINTYIENDLLPGRDVIVTFESQGNALDIGVVKRLIKEMF